MIKIGIILGTERGQANPSKLGLYKVLLLRPDSKIVNAIPLSYLASHNLNFYRISAVTYRPGDRVFLAPLYDEDSLYYVIIGSYGNTYLQNTTENIVHLYTSITGIDLTVVEPELMALIPANVLNISTDIYHKIISDLYLTSNPQFEKKKYKFSDIESGKTPSISVFNYPDEDQILSAILSESDEEILEFVLPKDLAKSSSINADILIRPELRILKPPYGPYTEKSKNLGNHIFSLYTVDNFDLNIRNLHTFGGLINRYILSLSDKEQEDIFSLDNFKTSNIYKDANNFVYTDNISFKDKEIIRINSLTFTPIKGQLKFADKLYTDKSLIHIKEDKYKHLHIRRLDKKDKIFELAKEVNLNDSLKEYKLTFSDFNLNNKGKIANLNNYSLVSIKPDEIIIRNNETYIYIKDKYVEAGIKSGNQVLTYVKLTDQNVEVYSNSQVRIKAPSILLDGPLSVNGPAYISGIIVSDIHLAPDPHHAGGGPPSVPGFSPSSINIDLHRQSNKTLTVQNIRVNQQLVQKIDDLKNKLINNILSDTMQLLTPQFDNPLLKALCVILQIIACILMLPQLILALLLKLIQEIIQSIMDLLKEMLAHLFNKLNEILNSIMDVIKQVLEFINAIINTILELINQLLELINIIIEFFLQIVDYMLNLINEIIDYILGITMQLLSCLTNGPCPLNLSFGLNIGDSQTGDNFDNLPIINDPDIGNERDKIDQSQNNLNNNIQNILNNAADKIRKLKGSKNPNIIRDIENILNITINLTSNELNNFVDDTTNSLLNLIQNKNPDLYNELTNVDQNQLDSLRNDINQIINNARPIILTLVDNYVDDLRRKFAC